MYMNNIGSNAAHTDRVRFLFTFPFPYHRGASVYHLLRENGMN